MTASSLTVPPPAQTPAIGSRRRISRVEVIAVALLALLVQQVAAAGVAYGIEQGVRWDFVAHAKNSVMSNEMGVAWPHFLPYVLISLPCGFCTDLDRTLHTMPAVVGALVGVKFVLTYLVLRRGLGFGRLRGIDGLRGVAVLAAVALAVGVSFSLPVPNLYRGQIPPNQWHNTTTIALMPFALLAFWSACEYLRRPGAKLAALVAAFGLLSIAAKPNFAMAFIPVFPLFVLTSGISRRAKAGGLAITAAMGVGLLGQYAWMYHSQSFAALRSAVLAARGQDPSTKWGLVVAPFETWSMVTPSIPVSLLASLLFPLAAIVARPSVARRSRELLFAWALCLVALASFSVFSETGRGPGAANFRWGGIATMYILFMASAAVMLARVEEHARSRTRDAVAWGIFAAHVATGILVLYIFARTGSYLELGPVSMPL